MCDDFVPHLPADTHSQTASADPRNRFCINTDSDLDVRSEGGEKNRGMDGKRKRRSGGTEREREGSGTEGEGGVIFVVGATKRETEWSGESDLPTLEFPDKEKTAVVSRWKR